MSLILKDTSKNYSPAPEGVHAAVCIDVIDKGMMTTKFGPKAKIQLRWELEEIDVERGGPYQVGNLYTASLNEKANLRKTLEIWRGKKFTPDELKGFDVEKLLGANCQVVVVHNHSDDGKTYANVTTVVPAARGQKLVPSASYVREKDRVPEGAEPETPAPVEIEDDDVPF